jgi:threonine dehydrogenase-like Zn-dependent dehydrogenase
MRRVTPGVAIIGCGLIGRKRARALGPTRLVVCVDRVAQRAESLAAELPGAAAASDWCEAIRHPEVDIVVIATTNDSLAPITLAAVQAGKHVLVEKPAARSCAELEPVIQAARRIGSLVRGSLRRRYTGPRRHFPHSNRLQTSFANPSPFRRPCRQQRPQELAATKARGTVRQSPGKVHCHMGIDLQTGYRHFA